jgi:hypothetical protein
MTDQLIQYEFHDALPLMAKGLHDLRISLAVQKLQSLHNEKQSAGSFMFFNTLKQSDILKVKKTGIVKKVIKRYIKK